MNYTKTHRLIALANELKDKLEKTKVLEGGKPNLNELFEAQREFGRDFAGKLRTILHELEGDVFTLKQRRFDPNIMQILFKVKGDLEHILLSIKDSRPHEAGWMLVDYVNDRNTKATLDNLDFLAQHHLKNTQEKIPAIPTFKHPEINFFQKLRALANEVKSYMESNPPLPIPGSTSPPPQEHLGVQHPSVAVGPEAKTKG